VNVHVLLTFVCLLLFPTWTDYKSGFGGKFGIQEDRQGGHIKVNWLPNTSRVVDPDRVGSASVCQIRIGIGIQGSVRIRDVYPGSRILIFTHPGSLDPKTASKEGGEKKLVVIPGFYCSHKFHKIENYFIFEMLKKKI
jgi:hypothetical protein